MTSAVALAEYVINKCIVDEHPITNLQLQKILYLIQREHLCAYNTRAFNDPIEAWKFGPAIPSAYYEFCYYGAMPISDKQLSKSANFENTNLLDKIIASAREKQPWDLAEDINRVGGAWSRTFRNGFGDKSVISVDLIQAEGKPI